MGRFEVDRKGLAKLLDGRGRAWVLCELVQNAWDADGVTRVEVEVERSYQSLTLRVTDDAPDGFADLTHAYTMFAESAKKADPTKRGRFNLGEKLAVAIADKAVIMSTRGTVMFSGEERMTSRTKLKSGSCVTLTFAKFSKEDERELDAMAERLLVPADIVMTYRGRALTSRRPFRTFEWTLPTEVAGVDGIMRPTQRKTQVAVFETNGAPARLYEHGIPVVETGDKYHISVGQKIPLTMERDNVRPSYLKLVRALTLNAMHSELEAVDLAQPWVNAVISDPHVEAPAVSTYLDAKYGEKRVAFDPKNPESVARAVAAGYTVISGGSEAGDTWEKIRDNKLALPAGQVFQPPKGVDMPSIEPNDSERALAMYSITIAHALIGRRINVDFVNEPNTSMLACYGGATLTYNVAKLGRAWFAKGPTPKVNSLLIHELGHEIEMNHLSEKYYHALTDLGAKLVELALTSPALFTYTLPT